MTSSRWDIIESLKKKGGSKMYVHDSNKIWKGFRVTVTIRGLRRREIFRRFLPYPIHENIRFHIKVEKAEKGARSIEGYRLFEKLPEREARPIPREPVNEQTEVWEAEITDTSPLLRPGTALYWFGNTNEQESLELISASAENTVTRNFFLAWGLFTLALSALCGLCSSITTLLISSALGGS
jgi:hypothetical protein